MPGLVVELLLLLPVEPVLPELLLPVEPELPGLLLPVEPELPMPPLLPVEPVEPDVPLELPVEPVPEAPDSLVPMGTQRTVDEPVVLPARTSEPADESEDPTPAEPLELEPG